MVRYQIIVKNKKEFEKMEGIKSPNFLVSTEKGYLYTFSADYETFLKLRRMAQDELSNIIYISAGSPVGPL